MTKKDSKLVKRLEILERSNQNLKALLTTILIVGLAFLMFISCWCAGFKDNLGWWIIVSFIVSTLVLTWNALMLKIYNIEW